ncbi:MAG: Methane oxygenase PmoA [Verrucomicrobiaceae bacterium]|nr:Methane oxygenase PmoA [Verrucomicrobiaceae bacterium]
MKTVACLLLLVCQFASATEVVVEGGKADREAAVVTFTAPKDLKGEASLQAADGTTLPLQINEDGEAVCVVPKLAKGVAATFTVGPKLDRIFPIGIEAIKQKDKVNFSAHSGQQLLPLMSYQMDPGEVPQGVPDFFAHGAHLHPIFSPSGKLVTGNHPPDHFWHRGIWLAWTHTEFQGRAPDFWNMGKEKGGELTGEVRFKKLVRTWSGPVQGGFVSEHEFIDHTSGSEVRVLNETWEVTTTSITVAGKPVFLIDLVSTQTCAGKDALKLPTYHYGGLGMRGNRAWEPAKAVTMVTSEGMDRFTGDGKKARWVHMGGLVDDADTGMAVLVHPGNFHAPQPMRLNPKNPQLCVAPSAEGDWSIEPGKPYVSRYRIVVVDGKADAAFVDALWTDYAEPLKAVVK